jgi:hypothetical protein
MVAISLATPNGLACMNVQKDEQHARPFVFKFTDEDLSCRLRLEIAREPIDDMFQAVDPSLRLA